MYFVGVFGQESFGEWFSGHDFVVAAVGFEAAYGGYQYGCVGGGAGVTTFDVEEPFGAHVGTKACFGK